MPTGTNPLRVQASHAEEMTLQVWYEGEAEGCGQEEAREMRPGQTNNTV